MGEAKLRGTFEERKAAAIQRDGIERQKRIRLEKERLTAMSEEERQRRRDAEIAWAGLFAQCLAGGTLPYFVRD